MDAIMKKKILLIGGGGHCHSVLDSILAVGAYEDIGIIDNVNSSFLGIPVIGTDDDVLRLKSEGWTDAFITIGSVGDTKLRHKLYEHVRNIGMNIPTIIDPTAVVAGGTEISEGVFIGKKAVINTGSRIETCAIINTGAIVEHDCIIGSFSHISSGATVCGQVRVGNDSHVGAGSVIRQQSIIGNNVLIGAGSVVVKDIPENVKAYGNPCMVVTE